MFPGDIESLTIQMVALSALVKSGSYGLAMPELVQSIMKNVSASEEIVKHSVDTLINTGQIHVDEKSGRICMKTT